MNLHVDLKRETALMNHRNLYVLKAKAVHVLLTLVFAHRLQISSVCPSAPVGILK